MLHVSDGQLGLETRRLRPSAHGHSGDSLTYEQLMSQRRDRLSALVDIHARKL